MADGLMDVRHRSKGADDESTSIVKNGPEMPAGFVRPEKNHEQKGHRSMEETPSQSRLDQLAHELELAKRAEAHA